MLYKALSTKNDEDINSISEKTNIIIGTNFIDSGDSDTSEDKSSSKVYLVAVSSTGTVAINVKIRRV